MDSLAPSRSAGGAPIYEGDPPFSVPGPAAWGLALADAINVALNDYNDPKDILRIYASIPEPGTLALLAGAFLPLGAILLRRRRI